MPTNQWGPYYITGAAGSGNVPTPTGVQPVPQSPSGSVTNLGPTTTAATTPPNAPPTYNHATILSTQQFLDNVINVASPQQGIATSNVAVKLAGVDPAAVQQNNWYSGNPATSNVGTKFS